LPRRSSTELNAAFERGRASKQLVALPSSSSGSLLRPS
jgi:hypothetical protein